MKRLVVLSGAGISAESGLKTFRDANGLWETHAIEEVATPEAFERNPELVHRFYNERRLQLLTCQPNAGHIELAKLEKSFDVHIVTQNVDDLHERAGSSQVLHLHGELNKARGVECGEIVDVTGRELSAKSHLPSGSRLRPHIVWFGEMVPLMDNAIDIMTTADIVIIVGTSLQVYPAASLYHYAPVDTPIFYIDPGGAESRDKRYMLINEKASSGLPKLAKQLLLNYS